MSPSRAKRLFALLVELLSLISLVSACGGDGGAAPPPVPAKFSYPTPPAFVINVPIDALAPASNEVLDSFTVAPALPAGLSLDAATGVLSGAPTAIAATAVYVVSATSAGGPATASLTITVNDVAPAIAYASPYYSFSAGVAAREISPTSKGGAVSTWSVLPALPSGLTVSGSSGTIAGTPIASAAAATYVVTASNSGGQSSASLTIAVSAGPLLDLGHVNQIEFIKVTPADVLSQDRLGHWALWVFATDVELASGNSPNVPNSTTGETSPLPVDLEGPTIVIQTSAGLEVRSASDGHVLSEIPATLSWWKLASDGSYLCAGNGTALTAWSPAGQVLFSVAGNYSTAVAFAAPSQVQVALSPAGQGVVQTVAVPSGAATGSAAFQGTFAGWFLDGLRFFTTVGSTVAVYSDAVAQLDLRALPTTTGLTGDGNWFWILDTQGSGQLTLYAVGASAQPTGTYGYGIETQAIASGSTVGLFNTGPGQVTVLDLSGATPVATSSNVPIASLSSFGATSSTQWVIGNGHGVLLDGASVSGAPRYLDYGAAFSIAGSSSDFAIATASGRIVYFNAATDALEGTINFSSSSIALSADGTVLAAMANTNDYQYETDRTVNIYSLPSAGVLNTFPANLGSPPYPDLITLSQSGAVLGEHVIGGSCDGQSISTMGAGGPIWCGDAGTNAVVLSPDGSLVAVTPAGWNDPSASTNMYKNGVLVAAVPGWAIAWTSNSSLLAGQFVLPPGAGLAGPVYSSTLSFSSTGTRLGSLAIPEVDYLFPASAGNLYSPWYNTVYSASTGAVTSMSASAGDLPSPANVGAASTSQIIFPSANYVLAEPSAQ